jgi:hypothetical protein
VKGDRVPSIIFIRFVVSCPTLPGGRVVDYVIPEWWGKNPGREMSGISRAALFTVTTLKQIDYSYVFERKRRFEDFTWEIFSSSRF